MGYSAVKKKLPPVKPFKVSGNPTPREELEEVIKAVQESTEEVVQLEPDLVLEPVEPEALEVQPEASEPAPKPKATRKKKVKEEE